MLRSMHVVILLTLCVGCLALSAAGCLDPMDTTDRAVVMEQRDDPTSAPGELTTSPAEGNDRLSTGGKSPSPVDDTPSEPATPDRPDEPLVPVPDPVDILDPAQFIAHEWGTFVYPKDNLGPILDRQLSRRAAAGSASRRSVRTEPSELTTAARAASRSSLSSSRNCC